MEYTKEKPEERFKTAEEKHKETVKLKCKVCGKKLVGKSTLSRHIAQAHNDMEPADREKIVIDTYYGHDVVEKTIRKFKEGKYDEDGLPIDISKYLHLAGIIKDKDEKEQSRKKHEEIHFHFDPSEFDSDEDKLLVKIVDSSESNEPTYFGSFEFDEAPRKLFITLTDSKSKSADYRYVVSFLKNHKLGSSKLFISSNGKLYPVKSIDVNETDEATGSQIKCVVAYDSTKPKE